MPTFPEWDRQVLDIAWEQTDFLSLHYYAGNNDDDFASFMGTTVQLEEQVDTLAGLLRFMKAKQRSRHDVHLSWDEWNVWYRSMDGDGRWAEAPRLLEEIYNLEDALVVAQWMNVFLRKCDVLKMACLAQIVNVIAPILTDRGRLVKQTTFYPFQLFRRFARGVSLAPRVLGPKLGTKKYGEIPVLDVSACRDAATGQSAVFIVNRHPAESVPTEIAWRGEAPKRVEFGHRLRGSDPKAANTFDHPDAVTPESLPGFPIRENAITLDIPPMSLTVLAAQ
jgi:alpha-N-arabinofuranosidase